MGIGIEPIGEMILIAMENAPEKTDSGLLLPEEAREKMNVGRVEAVGPEAKSIGVGDRVIYRQYSGTKMEWMGQDYLLIQEEDIQAKVVG
ncbi:MAG: co-chaperone GroES [Candidatus Thermoplasmatota archaeon]|nr:co-chaperone GroES [Candidatus Thermoplasmatota archaeon]